jgi:rRNA maturation protein Nop10
MGMGKYSEQNTCPKCGSVASITRYCDDRLDDDGNEKPNPSPYMGRQCVRCEFWRKEEPLDAPEHGKAAPFNSIVLPENWNTYNSAGRRDANPSRGYQLTGRYRKESKCPKCGNTTRSGTRFLNEIVDDNGHTFTLSAPVIERDCARCGYIRFEIPLDATEEGEVRATLKGRLMPGPHDPAPEPEKWAQ